MVVLVLLIAFVLAIVLLLLVVGMVATPTLVNSYA
jgi:hypothetical protein